MSNFAMDLIVDDIAIRQNSGFLVRGEGWELPDRGRGMFLHNDKGQSIGSRPLVGYYMDTYRRWAETKDTHLL